MALGTFTDEDGRLLVVASLAGAANHPAWFTVEVARPQEIRWDRAVLVVGHLPLRVWASRTSRSVAQ